VCGGLPGTLFGNKKEKANKRLTMADPSDTTLLIIRECFVYRIPPRGTSKGYRAADWNVESYIWTGRLRIASRGEQAIIFLEDPNNGELFAMSKYDPDSNSVESVTDSSRYFVVKIENDKGQHTFVGLGFQERTYAFDFNVCLQDHIKHIQNEKEAEKRRQEWDTQPKKDYSLRDGQSIQINIPGKQQSKAPAASHSPASNSGGGLPFLPPPPSGRRQPQPQQTPQQQMQQPQQQSNIDWGDFTNFGSK